MPRICITVPNKTPQPYRFPLDTEVVSIGRSAANDVVIEHGSVSSHHCEMKRVDGGFILSDSNSTNGIRLDEKQMEIIDLKNELNAEVGDVLFNYQLKEDEQEALSNERFKPHQKKKKKKSTASPKPPAAAPANQGPSLAAAPVSNTDNSARDFGIFMVFTAIACFAFYGGLNTAHRASLPKEERLGRSLWKDMNGTPAKNEN